MISSSLMCIDMMNVQQGIRELEMAGVDYLHIDIMDNHFVPNITLCPDFIRQLKRITSIPLDVHLMIKHPEQSLQQYDCLEGTDILTIHYESTLHPQRVLNDIRSRGVKSGIALNPATPVEVLPYLLDDLDMVLVMTVNPGFAGQHMIHSTLYKINCIRELLTANGRQAIKIAVDGNVSFENAVIMRAQGADLFVGGSSSVFHPGSNVPENCERLRECIR